jgi:hypothetical protein
MRTAVILLSVFSVLACPYDCAVMHAFAQRIEQESKPACCKHCEARAKSETSNRSKPSAPASDEDGRQCFCEGAVFDAATQTMMEDTLDVSLWTWLVDAVEISGIDQSLTSIDHASLPPPVVGRLTRIEIRSLIL